MTINTAQRRLPGPLNDRDKSPSWKQPNFGRAEKRIRPFPPPMTELLWIPTSRPVAVGPWFDLEKAKVPPRQSGKSKAKSKPSIMMGNAVLVGTRIAQTVAPMLAEIASRAKLELVEASNLGQGAGNAYHFWILRLLEWVADLDPVKRCIPNSNRTGHGTFWRVG